MLWRDDPVAVAEGVSGQAVAAVDFVEGNRRRSGFAEVLQQQFGGGGNRRAVGRVVPEPGEGEGVRTVVDRRVVVEGGKEVTDRLPELAWLIRPLPSLSTKRRKSG